jgi:hypothetical protein
MIIGEDETLHPAVTFESAGPELAMVGALDRMWARPGAEAVVEFRGARTTDLTLKIHRQESAAALSFRAPFRLCATIAASVASQGHPTVELRWRIGLDSRHIVPWLKSPASLMPSFWS